MWTKKINAKPSSVKEQQAADAALDEYGEIVGIKDTMAALIACQRRITANTRGYRARVRAHLGATAELALRAAKSETAWRSFIGQEFWKTCEGDTPKLTDRSDGLRFVVRFAESAKSRQAAQNSSRHATIIKYLLNEERIRPADFLSYLSKAGQGMNDVYNKATAGKAPNVAGLGDDDRSKRQNGSKRQPVQDRRQNGGSKRDTKDTPESPVRTVDLTRNMILEVHERHRLDELLSAARGRSGRPPLANWEQVYRELAAVLFAELEERCQKLHLKGVTGRVFSSLTAGGQKSSVTRNQVQEAVNKSRTRFQALKRT